MRCSVDLSDRRRAVAAALALAAVALSAASAACGSAPTERSADLVPLAPPGLPSMPAPTAPAPGTTPPTTHPSAPTGAPGLPDAAAPPAGATPGGTSGHAVGTGVGGTTADAAQRAAVSTVLARYDTALTALWADPAAIDPAHPAHAAWAATLVPGTRLAAEVAALHRSEVLDNDFFVTPPPGPDGRSWVHRAGEVVAAADGTLSFTWCGWGPGTGRSVASGAVVDDAVAVSNGVGVVREVGGTWLLDALDEVERDVLPPGTPNPCPVVPR